MANYIRFTDVTQIKVEATQEIRDLFLSLGSPQRRALQNRPGGQRSLLVKVAATHAGKITLNNGFYLPSKMRDGVPSWLSPYAKPILLHHDDHDDPVGRVRQANYVDTSPTQRTLFNSVTAKKDSIALSDKTLDAWFAGDLPFKDSVRVAIDYVIKNESIKKHGPDFQGLGYIELLASLSDPDTIQKVLDGRFLTGSVGAHTNHAVCSVCEKDWVEGRCEHDPGKEYEDSVCVLVAGDLEYEEWSYVNKPADVHSGTIEVYMDGVKKDSISYNPTSYKTPEVCLTISDSEENKMPSLKERLGEDTYSLLVVDESEEDIHYASMIADALDGVIVDEDGFDFSILKEAKLSSETRKNMSASTFCKPGERKYPVPDCAHAKSAMAYAKKYNESSSVVACINRKASRLGCPFGKSKDSAPPYGIFNVEYFDQFEDETLYQLLAGIKLTMKDRSLDCENCEEQLAELKSLQGVLEETKKALDEAKVLLATREDELALTQSEKEGNIVALVKATEDFKRARAEYIVALRQISGETLDATQEIPNLMKLEVLDLNKTLDDLLGKVDIQKVTDKLHSGMARDPGGLPVADPTLGEIREDKTQQVTLTKELLGTIQEEFIHIRMTQGQDAAERWLDSLKRKGLLPKEMPAQ